MVFEDNYKVYGVELFVTIICGIILIVDIASAILHATLVSVASRRDISSQNKGKN